MDILFENGTIRTLERNSPDAQALLVRNGRIAAVGGRTAVEDQTGNRRPPGGSGRQDAAAGVSGRPQPLYGGGQPVSAGVFGGLHLLGGHAGPDPGLHPAGAHPCRAVGTAQGYDHNLLSERRHPDRLCLDAAAPDNPVVICHQSGHMGVFNTAALERLVSLRRRLPPPEASSDGRTAPSPATWRKTPFWSSRSGCP